MPAIGATNAAIAAVSCNEAFKCVRVQCSACGHLHSALPQVLLQVRPHNAAANSKSILLVLARIHYRFLVLFDDVCGRYTRRMGDDSGPWAPNDFKIKSAAGLWSQDVALQNNGCDACRSIKTKYPVLTMSGSTTLRDALPQLAAAVADEEVFFDYKDHENVLTMDERETFRFVTLRCVGRDFRSMVVN